MSNHHRRGRPLILVIAAVGVTVLLTVAAGALWYAHGDGAPTPVVAGSTPRPATTGPAGGTPTSGAPTTAPPSPTASASHRATPTAAPAGQRLVTFVNALNQTLWVAGWQQTPQPALSTTGWVLPAGQRLTITVPDKWNGRFWGRTGCSFDGSGKGHCETGDCAGRFQCRQYGAIPATLAEYNFNSWHDLDFYDVSLVDGANVPMWINIVRGGSADAFSANGCTRAGCTADVDCPSELAVTTGGRQVGCISPCARFDTDQYCCRGQWAPRSACDPTKWPVNYAAIFKKAEPFAYSYVDDDATSTFTCVADCDYRITFGVTPG